MPATMSEETVQAFSNRLKEYAIDEGIKKINIIFHGGEPLMCGEKKLISFVDLITIILGKNINLQFSLQTNGTLITESFLNECVKRNIGISLSIDGNKSVHDKHRKYKNGKGSHDVVLRNLMLLKKYDSIFDGVLGVIDPYYQPENILSFFDEIGIKNVDLLLPDSTYIDLPPGRDEEPNLYTDWLIEAFDSWFYDHQTIQLRTFEYIIAGLLGGNTSLDAFGLGELDYFTIETDGSYHTTDILKVAYENASAIGFGVFDKSIKEALNNKKVIEYNEYLTEKMLPDKCKVCIYSHLCGGGSLPHRYNKDTGFNNPTVYCREMYSLIQHANEIINKEIDKELADG